MGAYGGPRGNGLKLIWRVNQQVVWRKYPVAVGRNQTIDPIVMNLVQRRAAHESPSLNDQLLTARLIARMDPYAITHV